ncbi:tetratricopeptide repeat protein [Nocardia caishijiensis]|uniref:Tetratricopeptide repeat protein n=1 Tax=Nocardia caishijiensis TaxID=184756 RepID=A0ABQ6YUI7_9NOCA|nr:tetratricopeptide repeat protein [Nocardia caishijiensis]KAF0849366.1 tetratricopeptide repeat protein [Nocardia caishijiensis]
MAATGRTSDGDDDQLAAGYAAYQRGDVLGALETFERAAEDAPPRLRSAALINAASMADELGEHRRSVSLMRTALAVMPPDAAHQRPAALVNLSQAYQHLGELDSAQETLEEARLLLADGTEQGLLPVACLLSLTAVALHRQQWARAGELAAESLEVTRRLAPELAGHPLMNLAAASFEIGRRALAVDFASQALAAFEAAGDTAAVAETQQNLAIMLVRSGRYDDAEGPLRASQRFFEDAELAHRVGIGAKTYGYLAESRGASDTARTRYQQALDCFDKAGAVLDAADVRLRLATVAAAEHDLGLAEDLLAMSYEVYAGHGLGMHCAQLDYWHAELLHRTIEADPHPDPAMLSRALALAVPAALAIDAVRHTLPNGNQREHWHRTVAEPAMRLAFQCAARTGDGQLVTDLVDSRCAGTSLDVDSVTQPRVATLEFELLDPPVADESGPALQLGTALADVAAAAGIRVNPPPRLSDGGRIILSDYIIHAEQRYGRLIRDDRVIVL